MKKIISVLLAALLLCGVFAVAAFAEDEIGYTAVYTVGISEWNEGQVLLTPAEGYGAEVEKGASYKFTLEAYNGYKFDKTTVVKILPAKSYGPDIVLTNLDAGYGEIITPDEKGVYTIDNVEEDVVVAVYNLQNGNLPEIKDFLYDMFHFFLQLFQWFFGLSKNA